MSGLPRVALVSTDDRTDEEKRPDGCFVNAYEASLVARAVLRLLARGVPRRRIIVLARFRSQGEEIAQMLSVGGAPGPVEVRTWESCTSQEGRCEIAILATTRTSQLGTLASDEAGALAAMSAATHHLLVAGSARLMAKHSPFWGPFLRAAQTCVDLEELLPFPDSNDNAEELT